MAQSGQIDQVDSLEILSGKLSGIQGKILIRMSFDAGYVGAALPIEFDFPVRIVSVHGIVTKLIEATNDATIQLGGPTGDMANGLLTFTAGSALNTLFTVSPTTNNELLIDEAVTFTSAKVTAGGEVLLNIEYKRL